MLTNFKQAFDNSYQAVFQKVLVAMEIANTRFESSLSYGSSVARVKYDLAQIRVRDITIGTNRTIDPLTDASETLLVNKNKGSDFRVSKKEMIQAGPLNPGEIIGASVAHKLSRYVDGDVLAEVRNANFTFDTGDLTTVTSSGTPITLSTTNIPQLLAQGRAKLRNRGNQDLSNLALVIDGYSASIMEQYLMGKNIDLAGAVFKNGYAGQIGGAEVFLSENLPADAVLTISANPTAGQTIIINGFTFTFVASVGTTAGNVLLEASNDLTMANLVDAINQNAATAGTKFIVWTDTSPNYDLSTFLDFRIVASYVNATDKLSLTTTGSGRLTFGGTATIAATVNYIHLYYGKKGAIDVVVQDLAEMDMVDDPYQRAKIIRCDAIYGIKTFSDGKPQFLDVQVV